jgi:putative SOS response-associated peptidase YedK
MHFGLLAKGSPRMIPNARAETAYAKRSFKNVAPTRRCAIPTSGFIDWLDDEGRKRPHCFTLATDKPFAMGALWNPGDEPAGVPPSFCIVTTEPNELVARVHNRMPVILRDEHLARWLDPAPMTEPEFLRIAERIPSSAMAAREVSDTINSSRNEGPDCIAPPAPRDTQMGLF